MLPNSLMKRAYLTPARIALRMEGEEWSFLQLYEEAQRYAERLTTWGVKKKTRIALHSETTSTFYIVIHACLLVQAEIVMLNTRLTQDELRYQLEDADVAYVLTDRVSYFDVTERAVLSFKQFEQLERTAIELEEEVEADATATIMYTSGTTGFPKGVRQTYQNHTANALASITNLGFLPSDCWLCTMPLFHISGFSIMMRSVLYGMTVHVERKFDPVRAAELIVRGEVTIMSAVTKMIGQIVEVLERNDEVASSRFRFMLGGGGVVPEAYIERAHTRRLPILQTYGMTETSSQTATLMSEESMTKVGSVGKPLYFNSIRIGEGAAPYEHGEIFIKGPHVTPGYIGRFARHDALQNGWFATGDIGYFDHEGYLYVVDRRNDLIISGGENIYPAELEKVLMRHPAIVEAGVCGIADEEWGQVPVAYVVTSSPLTEEQVIAHCERYVARYKLPKAVRFCTSLPRNASNKLLRRELLTWEHSQSNESS